MSIRIELKKGSDPEYKKLIKMAKKDKVFKACGNPDDPWVILKFETEPEFNAWLWIRGK